MTACALVPSEINHTRHGRPSHFLHRRGLSIWINLDELAAAMIDKNVEYAEDLLDRQSEELPTFHVVHEQENALDPTPSPSRSPRRKGNAPEPSPQHMTLN